MLFLKCLLNTTHFFVTKTVDLQEFYGKCTYLFNVAPCTEL